MKNLLHPHFKLNGETFASTEDLKNWAKNAVEKGAETEISIGKFISEWLDENECITVKTSGSTGVPKKITLQKKHVFNSARATVSNFNLYENTRALLCLPSEYIAGKMMLVRAIVSGWDLFTTLPNKKPLKNASKVFDFSAMVPYQVFHSLEDLHKLKKLIVGGGAISSELEQQLQKVSTQIFATYGMTETISHVAIRPINGNEKTAVFSALPKVNFSQTEAGCLQIHAPEISEEIVITNDVVELISPTSFKFLGRMDNVINTGGVKVHPEELEKKLSQFINRPFFIASEKDSALGERIILVMESKMALKLEDFSEFFKTLSKYEKPRKLYTLPIFLYTETGKIKRAEILKLIKKERD